MGSLVFIHGTGVRRADYDVSLAVIKEKFAAALPEGKRRDWTVVECPWGDSAGIALGKKRLSIPDYKKTGGAGPSAGDDSEERILLWEMLYDDPLYELRGLALRPPCESSVSAATIRSRLEALPSAKLRLDLQLAGIDVTFDDARRRVAGSRELEGAIDTTESSSDLWAPLARAITAEAVALLDVDQPPPRMLFDSYLRDEIAEAIADELSKGRSARSVAAWAGNVLYQVAQALGATDALVSRRGRFMDAISPATGDILLYQARGDAIRTFIRDTVLPLSPPVILFAHSLGGIACVDLLVKLPLPAVKLLVTVGSQAPFLYEIDALTSLRPGESLPASFPAWLNVYDRRDFLSFKAAGVIARQPGQTSPVVDVEVDNRLPFPESHSGYWANPQTWDHLVKEIP